MKTTCGVVFPKHWFAMNSKRNLNDKSTIDKLKTNVEVM